MLKQFICASDSHFNFYFLYNILDIIRIDKVFSSHFWRELSIQADTRLNYSTTYHPQSDGQTEVVNQEVESYLRCFCGEKPKEWVKWLHWAEFWYNNYL